MEQTKNIVENTTNLRVYFIKKINRTGNYVAIIFPNAINGRIRDNYQNNFNNFTFNKEIREYDGVHHETDTIQTVPTCDLIEWKRIKAAITIAEEENAMLCEQNFTDNYNFVVVMFEKVIDENLESVYLIAKYRKTDTWYLKSVKYNFVGGTLKEQDEEIYILNGCIDAAISNNETYILMPKNFESIFNHYRKSERALAKNKDNMESWTFLDEPTKFYNSIQGKKSATLKMERVFRKSLEILNSVSPKEVRNRLSSYNKELSGKQYVNYSVLRRGDFSFNKGNSKKYPYGCTYMLRDRDIAAVPNAFYSFRIVSQHGEYLEQLFSLGCLSRQLKRLINAGVRDDGLFNLYEHDFYGCEILLPALSEQQKIAEILTEQDRLIATKQRLIEVKKQQKRWLMRNLLTGKIRLPGFNKKWEHTILEKLMQIETGNRNTEDKIIGGQFLFFVRSQQVESINSYSYDCEAVLTAGDGAGTGKVYHYINGKFDAHQRVYIMTQFEKIKGIYFYYFFSTNFLKVVNKYTAKTSVDSVRRHMISNMPILLPSLPEQTAIAEILTTADREIELLIKDLEQYKLIKKYLMQQLLTGKRRVCEVMSK